MKSTLEIWISWFLVWAAIGISVAFLIWAAHRSRTREWARILLACLGLGSALGFFLWLSGTAPRDMQEINVQLSRYPVFLLIGLGASLIAGIAARLLKAGPQLARLNLASCLAYFGFLKVLGWSAAPWIAAALVMPAFLHLRRSGAAAGAEGSSVLILQVMGTIAGLYMSFHLPEFLAGWAPFTEVAASLWLLLARLA